MTITVHSVSPADEETIELVAQRMRQTLVEVLGEEATRRQERQDPALARGYGDRARFHLDPHRSQGAIFVAREGVETIGHIIVRVESEDGGSIGYFSTIYVDPRSRRQNAARLLLDTGEAWLRARGMRRFVTYTDKDNTPLISLYSRAGFRLVPGAPLEMVKLEKQD